MFLNCITAIIIVTIICITIVINNYISKKTADYKATLQKRKIFMKDIGIYIQRINKNFENIDVNEDVRELINSDLRFITNYIYKYCDEIE